MEQHPTCIAAWLFMRMNDLHVRYHSGQLTLTEKTEVAKEYNKLREDYIKEITKED